MSKYIETEGKFNCVVSEADGWFGESSNGTPFIRLPLRVVDGPHLGEISVYQAWISEAAIGRTIANLKKVFGFDGDLEALANGGFSFAGKACSITTGVESYGGEERIKIKWLNAPGESGKAKTVDPKDIIAKLNARSKEIAASIRDDDDVPF